MIPFSILDLSPITEGGSAARALANTLDLARHGERLGFNRFWVAEHHNMPGIASAATAVVLAYVGAGTSTIRIGAGGVMLPNHAPLVIAEQFGTLAALFPGRVDLGLGRAPGTDPVTARALRRTLISPDEFPRDVVELMAYLGDPGPQIVRAVPGAGSHVPIWILGSSLFGAQVAAALGLPFSFASHFAPTHLMEAIRIYRERFESSAQLARPYVMLGVNVVAAPSDAEARFLASSQRQSFTSLRQGHPIQLPPPSEDWQKPVEPATEQSELDRVLNASVVGSPDTVLRLLDAFVERTGADELIITSQIYDHAARLESYRLVAEVRTRLVARVGQPKIG
jgi:luciferase family oxidoreductase group 1